MIRLTVFFLLVVSGCRTLPQNSFVKNVSSPQVVFNLPECLPGCSASDQAELTVNSKIEGIYVEAIKAAKTSVDFSQFTFSRKPIFDALIDAAGRGVRVRGLVDRAQLKTTGGYCQPTGCVLPPPYSDPAFLGSPIQVRLEKIKDDEIYKNGTMSDRLVLLLTSTPEQSGVKSAPGKERLVHNKFAIVDESILLAGSGNWSSTAISVNLENLTRFESSTSSDTLKAYSCMFALVWGGDPNVISQRLSSCQIPGRVYFSPAASSAVLSGLDRHTRPNNLS